MIENLQKLYDHLYEDPLYLVEKKFIIDVQLEYSDMLCHHCGLNSLLNTIPIHSSEKAVETSVLHKAIICLLKHLSLKYDEPLLSYSCEYIEYTEAYTYIYIYIYERPQGIYCCLGGELWYLQHNCVGDAVVYCSGSDISFITQHHPLVIHGHLTLTPQCTLWCARDTPENPCEEI